VYIDINTLFTFEVSKSDDQSILATIVPTHRSHKGVKLGAKQLNISGFNR
jgi:hypothetical protein